VSVPVAATWRYHLPNENGEGWAIAFLDSSGVFTSVSDYGDYGHRWPQAGWGPEDFRAFFLQCDDSYILGKISRRDEYDGDRTVRAIKDRILELRPCGCGEPAEYESEDDPDVLLCFCCKALESGIG